MIESNEADITAPSIYTVSAEERENARLKYIEGLDAFNQDDYEQARKAWMVAKQLDPGNKDVDLALRKVEELLKSESAGAKE